MLKSLLRFIVTAALMLTPVAAVPEGDDHLSIATYDRPEGLNPYLTSSIWNSQLHSNLFSGLVVIGPGGEIVGDLAESWTVSEDQTTYKFTLRDNLRWSDGEPITAQTLKRSLEIKFDHPGLAYQSLLNLLRDKGEAATVISDREIALHLRKPARFFLTLLTEPASAPIPLHVLDHLPVDKPWPLGAEVPFSGPYVLQTVSDSSVSAVANTQHHAMGDLHIKSFDYAWFDGEDTVIYRDIANGTVDLGLVRTAFQKNFIKSRLADYIIEKARLSQDYLAINTKKPPFDNPQLRQALHLALDRAYGNVSELQTEVVPTYEFLPQGLRNYPGPVLPEWIDWPYARRVAEARKIMESLGYNAANPLRLELSINEAILHKRVATAIRSMWNAIHVETDVVSRSVSEHYKLVRAGDFEVARVGWIADVNDPHDYLSLFETGNTYNYSRWSNANYDELIQRAQAADMDETTRKLQREALRILQSEVPRIPLHQRLDVLLKQPSLKGLFRVRAGEYLVRWMRFEQ